MINEKYLFFRECTDEDNSHTGDAQIMIPVSNVTGIWPHSTTEVRIHFKSVHNFAAATVNGGSGVVTNDFVKLVINEGKHASVVSSIIEAINGKDNFVVIADNVTTFVDGSTRVLGEYINKNIIGCDNVLANELTVADYGGTGDCHLPEIIWGAATTALSDGLDLDVNTNYHSVATAVTVALPSAAAGKKGDWITVTYTTVINNGAVHTFNTTTDATFVAGSKIIRIGGAVASGIDVCDGSAKNTLVIDGDTDGDGGIGTTIKFINTTGATDGWAAEAIVLNQGDGSAAMASATTFPA